MDKIEKALRKLSVKEKSRIERILKKLNSGELKDLDVKKLKGRDDIFRLRSGNIRIIYRFQSGNIFILSIDRRRENTYKL